MRKLSLSKDGPTRKIVCISHIKDVDGCVSAALIRCATGARFLLANYGNLSECLGIIKNNYDFVYVCDLGINKSVLEEFQRIQGFTELIYIDHHILNKELLKALKGMNVTVVHNTQDCAGALTYNLFKEVLPHEAGLLASYAAVADRLENGPLATRILQRYDRDFVLFETMLLSYALEMANVEFKKMVVQQLSKLEYPHHIRDVAKLGLEHADRIVVLRRELPSRAFKLGKVVYVDAKGDPSGAIASLLLDVCEATIGLSYENDPKKQVSDMSIRGGTGEMNLGEITSQLAIKLGGFGGGHPRASGARIPTSKLMEFIRALSQYSD